MAKWNKVKSQNHASLFSETTTFLFSENNTSVFSDFMTYLFSSYRLESRKEEIRLKWQKIGI